MTVTFLFIPIVVIAVIVLFIWGIRRRRRKARNNIMMLLILLFAVSGCSSGTSTPASTPPPQFDGSLKMYTDSGAGISRDEAESGQLVYGTMGEYEASPEAVEAPAEAAADSSGIMYSRSEQQEAIPQDNLTGMEGEKILRTGNVELETDTFDTVVDELRFAAVNSGGFVESANITDMNYKGYMYNRSDSRARVLNMTLRVPREQFDSVFELVTGIGKLITSGQNSEDVTAQYYDTARRLETKKVEEERVLEMSGRAEKIEDLLALEERLGQIRTDIELYQTQMLNIDRLAAYSTINVILAEVLTEEYIISSGDLGGRLQLAFVRGINNTVIFLQNALLFLAEIFIQLIFILLLVVIGFVIYKRKAIRKQEAQEAQEDSQDQE
jgi:preprotein translocase subunit YajC